MIVTSILINQDIISNPFDEQHFNILHSVQGPITPWQILEKGKFYELLFKVFHIDIKNYHTQFFEDDNNETVKRMATLHFSFIPVLFGYPLTTIGTTLRSCPPVYVVNQDIKFLNINMFLLATSIPISQTRNLVVVHFYRPPGFISKLFARILFSSLSNMVILVDYFSYLLIPLISRPKLNK